MMCSHTSHTLHIKCEKNNFGKIHHKPDVWPPSTSNSSSTTTTSPPASRTYGQVEGEWSQKSKNLHDIHYTHYITKIKQAGWARVQHQPYIYDPPGPEPAASPPPASQPPSTAAQTSAGTEHVLPIYSTCTTYTVHVLPIQYMYYIHSTYSTYSTYSTLYVLSTVHRVLHTAYYLQWVEHHVFLAKTLKMIKIKVFSFFSLRQKWKWIFLKSTSNRREWSGKFIWDLHLSQFQVMHLFCSLKVWVP